MGYGTEAEKQAKKIYSLAYHRATAAIVKRHEDEFKQLLEAYRANIAFELETFGDIETTRNPRKHVAGADGRCEHDGQEWPCSQEKNNVRNRAKRSAGSSTSGSSSEETPALTLETQ